MKRAHVRARGRVQGVFFRSETRARARSLGVSGWVRNDRDGSVEAVFEGSTEAVDTMVAWYSRGPAGASVDDVEIEWEEPHGESEFAVR